MSPQQNDYALRHDVRRVPLHCTATDCAIAPEPSRLSLLRRASQEGTYAT